MRNPVARHDYNRSATHQDRSKLPQNTVDEGLLDYYAENAENVAQTVYGIDSVRLFLGNKEIKRLDDHAPKVKVLPLSEEDKRNRVLRVEFTLDHISGTLTELMDSFVRR